MEIVVRERRRFFERPEEPRIMRVTARDLTLLENVARLRLASTSQLAALDGGSAQNVSRALLALWENGYVERPEAQVASRVLYEGSRPKIYGLTRKGATLLRGKTASTYAAGSWTVSIKNAARAGASSSTPSRFQSSWFVSSWRRADATISESSIEGRSSMMRRRAIAIAGAISL